MLLFPAVSTTQPFSNGESNMEKLLLPGAFSLSILSVFAPAFPQAGHLGPSFRDGGNLAQQHPGEPAGVSSNLAGPGENPPRSPQLKTRRIERGVVSFPNRDTPPRRKLSF